MALAAPVGSYGHTRNYLRLSLADSTAFRTWVSAATQAAALARIYMDALPPPAGHAEQYTLTELNTYRPYAVIWSHRHAWRQVAVSSDGDEFDEGPGRLGIQLVQTVGSLTDHQEIARAFENIIDGIVDALCAKSGTAGYLAFDRIGIEQGPVRVHPNWVPHLGDEQHVDLVIDYGGQGA